MSGATMPAAVRSAMRIAALEEGPHQHEAMRRMSGGGAPAVWATILAGTLQAHEQMPLSEQDRQTLAAGALAALAEAGATGRQPDAALRAKLRQALAVAVSGCGLSLRAAGEAMGVSHTAAGKIAAEAR